MDEKPILTKLFHLVHGLRRYHAVLVGLILLIILAALFGAGQAYALDLTLRAGFQHDSPRIFDASRRTHLVAQIDGLTGGVVDCGQIASTTKLTAIDTLPSGASMVLPGQCL